MSAREQTVVPILGMHRSGSSMLTRALNLLGLDLGQPLLDPTPDNPLGYWENTFFVRTNVELLRTMNCQEDGFAAPQELARVPPLCDQVIIEDDKRAEVRDFMDTTFQSPAWGWKDPRTVLTWELWQRLLTDLGFIDVRPVIIVRHPGPSVRSLIKRVRANPAVQMPEQQLARMAIDVWTAYNEILWKRCNQRQWLVTTCAALTDPRRVETELQRLADYCGLDESRIASAMASINLVDASNIDEHCADRRAMQLYDQFCKRAAAPTSTIVPSEPDELRLLQQAEKLKRNGRIDAAVDLLTKALNIRSHYRAARFQLGYTLMETGHITRSAEHADVLINSNPDDPVGHGLRAFGFTQQARIANAIDSFRKCIRCLPSNNVAWSNMLFSSLYSDQLDASEVTQLHVEAGEAIAQNSAAAESTDASGDPDSPAHGTSTEDSSRLRSGRPLRIGYLSGDFKKHPVGYFIRSILTHHDADRFHTTSYDISPAHDELTAILRMAAHEWCDVRELSDDQLLKRIHSDGIDVLIDLCGHSSGNRAAMMARRAAPVQAMYLGYPSTSGLPNMDFVISDEHISPPEFDDLYSERVLRLKDCFLCFHPYDDAPEISPLPFDRNGFITFGSFNNLPNNDRIMDREFSLSGVDGQNGNAPCTHSATGAGRRAASNGFFEAERT